jgi:hypothetical protein
VTDGDISWVVDDVRYRLLSSSGDVPGALMDMPAALRGLRVLNLVHAMSEAFPSGLLLLWACDWGDTPATVATPQQVGAPRYEFAVGSPLGASGSGAASLESKAGFAAS